MSVLLTEGGLRLRKLWQTTVGTTTGAIRRLQLAMRILLAREAVEEAEEALEMQEFHAGCEECRCRLQCQSPPSVYQPTTQIL